MNPGFNALRAVEVVPWTRGRKRRDERRHTQNGGPGELPGPSVAPACEASEA